MNRIAIAMPVRDTVTARTCFDLAAAIATHAVSADDVMIPLFSEGTYISNQRNSLVKEARREEATHILFVDSDMRFPADAIARLLGHDVSVVAVNYSGRAPGAPPTAAVYGLKGRRLPVYTEADFTGLEAVDACGCGLMLIEMPLFDRIPYPWFSFEWISDGEREGLLGEDSYFCRAVRRLNVPIWIDHALSREVTHVGIIEYRLEHANEWRRLEREREAASRPLVELISD